MRRGVFGACPTLLAAVGLATAQTPDAPPPAPQSAAAINLPPFAPLPDNVGEQPAGGTANGKPVWTDTHVGPQQTAWLSAGYSFMWLQEGPQPFPLAIVGPPASRTIGGSNIDFGTFNGMKADGGFWFDQCHRTGVYFGGFFTEQRSVSDSATSDALGSPAISRPYIDALRGTNLIQAVSIPGFVAGGFGFNADARLLGAEAGLLRNLYECQSYTVNMLLGYRYLDLDENLELTQISRNIDGSPIPYAALPGNLGQSAAAVLIQDRFHTRNSFFGGTIGFDYEYRIGRLSAGLVYKVSLGTNHENVEIIGQTSAADGSNSVSGGLLAVPGIPARIGNVNGMPVLIPALPNANFGRNTNNRFVVVPEVGLKLGWQLTDSFRLISGADFLYMNDVARPGSQIDPVVNQRYVPVSPLYGTTAGPVSPTFTYRSDSFYAFGVNFGCEFKY